nr:hypothetical protein [Tanacetum cinerariifolium]
MDMIKGTKSKQNRAQNEKQCEDDVSEAGDEMDEDIHHIDEEETHLQDAVKEEPALNKKFIEATKAYKKNSTNLTKLLTLIKSFDFQGLKSLVEYLQASALRSNNYWGRTYLTMTEIFEAFKETPSQTKGEKAKKESTKKESDGANVEKEPVVEDVEMENPESPPVAPKADKGKDVATKENEEPTKKLVPASREVCQNLDEPIRVPYEIYGKILLKAKPITDIKIHPNTKPVVLTIYKGNDIRYFDVHNPFKFADVGFTELDELVPIIEKKKSKIVGVLMISLRKRYERLKKIPKELGIQSALPTLTQA